jgi:hypothetical protein
MPMLNKWIDRGIQLLFFGPWFLGILTMLNYCLETIRRIIDATA